MTEFAFKNIPWKHQSVGPYNVWRYRKSSARLTGEVEDIQGGMTFIEAMQMWATPLGNGGTRLLVDGGGVPILGEVLGPMYQFGCTEEIALWREEFLGPNAPAGWAAGFMKFVNGQED